MVDANDAKDINRLKFLTRLSAELGKRGAIDVLQGRRAPPGQPLRPVLRHAVRRQRQGRGLACAEPLLDHAPAGYSMSTRRPAALDLGLFINGLPIATFELKNSLTKADRGRRGGAVPARPQPARAACSNSAAAWCTSRWTMPRCACAPS